MPGEQIAMSAVSRREFLSATLAVPALRYQLRTPAAHDRLGASTACLAGLSVLDAIKQLERIGFATLEMIAYTGARHSVGDIPGFAYDQASSGERDMEITPLLPIACEVTREHR